MNPSHSASAKLRRRLVVALVATLLVAVSLTASRDVSAAADVGPTRTSLPSGPGSMEGVVRRSSAIDRRGLVSTLVAITSSVRPPKASPASAEEFGPR